MVADSVIQLREKAMTMTVRLGTRGSRLALWQTNWVINEIKKNHPQIDFEIKVFTTQGDKIQDISLRAVNNDDGFFVRELETALLNNEIDLAVHSLKDLPHQQPQGLVVPVTPIRQDARDALFSRGGGKLTDLPTGARIGTDSVRRASQLLNFRSDYQIMSLRGNVDTRLRKLHDPELGYDAIVLALAGVSRLDMAKDVAEKIPYRVMLPAPGQGALAPECRSNDRKLIGILNTINDLPSRTEVECEKAFMAALGGGCQTPVGCKAEVVWGKLIARGFVGSPDGKQAIRVELQEEWQEGPMGPARDLGKRLADLALEQGAREVLDEARANGYVTARK